MTYTPTDLAALALIRAATQNNTDHAAHVLSHTAQDEKHLGDLFLSMLRLAAQALEELADAKSMPVEELISALEVSHMELEDTR
jgi:hypothetical protein